MLVPIENIEISLNFYNFQQKSYYHIIFFHTTTCIPEEVALSKGPNRAVVSPSPEDGNRSSFRNVVFYNVF
jgi:hypothetical protein